MDNHKYHSSLANESIGKLLWQLSLPAGVGMFVMALYNVVDTMFIGQTVGPLGIAALSIAFPVQMFIISLGGMVGLGGASVISRALGAKLFSKAEATLGNIVSSSVVISIVLTAVIVPNMDFWLSALGATENITPLAQEYLSIIVWGAIFQVFAMSMNSAVRSEGNAKVAMLTMIIGAATNIGLDALFILKLGMGIRGAATATIIAQAVSCGYLIFYYQNGGGMVKIHLANLKIKWDILREIIAIGTSSFVRMVSTSFVMALLNRTVVGLGGEMYLAAVGIVGRVASFAIMPLIAVAQGLQPILGFSYGAKRYDRSLEVINSSIKIATIISVIAFFAIFFFSKQIIGIFSNDIELVEIGGSVMRTIFLVWYLVGFQLVASTLFQAIGKARPAFLTATARQILFLLPLLLILPRYLGLQGVWISYPIADGIGFGFTLALFLKEMRNLKAQHDLMKDADKDIEITAPKPDVEGI